MIKIRPYVSGDAQSLFEAAQESLSSVGAWLWWCTPDFTLEAARSWVDQQALAFPSKSEFEFAILSESGRYLGGCGLNAIDKRNARANLGYWVRSSVSGQGVATAAVRELVNWAFSNTDLVRLEIVIAKGNSASLRVAEKLGAVHEGILRQRLQIHGMFQDSALFSILRSDISSA
jgi:RimJ/RimL family protein N-acetyltransferase